VVAQANTIVAPKRRQTPTRGCLSLADGETYAFHMPCSDSGLAFKMKKNRVVENGMKRVTGRDKIRLEARQLVFSAGVSQ